MNTPFTAKEQSLRLMIIASIGIWVCFLCPILIQAAPLPGQIMVNPSHPAWLAYNCGANGGGRLDPYFMCGPGDPEGFLYRGWRRVDGTRASDQTGLIRKLMQYGRVNTKGIREITL